MIYLSELREGSKVIEHYLCTSKQVLKTRAGKTYYSLRLQDKTGTIDAKIWELNEGIDHFEVGDSIKVEGAVVTFQNALQLNVRRLRRSNEGEYDPKDYVPTSKQDIETMYQELLGYIERIDNPHLSRLVKDFFVEDKDFVQAFKHHTAAKVVHHNFLGGLLEHTLGIVKICDALSRLYPQVSYDLLVSGALFHDIGKIKELSEFPLIEYTEEGHLLGHIVIGMEWVSQKIREIDGFPVHLANQLKHMILAHHGELEYGSPKKPALLEAVLLHYADNIDAKVMTFTTLASQTEDTWLGYQRIFESNLRKTVL